MTDRLLTPTDAAAILAEALPYIKRFHGRTIVVKYGGNAMIEENLKQCFARDVVLLKLVGMNVVVVHGGGPQIESLLGRVGKKGRFIQGMRVTDDATLDVVEMVLVGKVNKQIVNLINLNGGQAVGLSGKDGRLIKARKLEMYIEQQDAAPEILDLGKVGEVVDVNVSLIHALEREHFIPVIAPVGVDEEGATYNINADSVAGAVASALKAKRLILLTDVPGVLDKNKNLISSLSRFEAVVGIEDGTMVGGMIPKVKCCLEALEEGVDKAMIIDGRVENCILLELFTDAGIGTEIVNRRSREGEYKKTIRCEPSA